MRLKTCLPLLISFYLCTHSHGQKMMLDPGMHHLRNGTVREWSSFPVIAKDSQLIVHFNFGKISGTGTIGLRQYEVTQDWKVSLNGNSLGKLTLDEKDMISYFEISAGMLRNKDNVLSISPATTLGNGDVSDDIKVGQVFIDTRPLPQILSEVTLELTVTDAHSHQLLPSRITITDKHGTLQPIGSHPNANAAVRTGVFYSGSGKYSFSLPAGMYKIYASRGFEYGVDSMFLNLKPGERVEKKLLLRHEVPAYGWVSCDPHIHSLTYSGHGDATLRERIITIAGEGIRFPVITEHNASIDISDTVKKMGMNEWFTPVTGDEVTTSVGHFNVFPVSPSSPIVDDKVKNWNDLAASIENSKDIRMVILNHARDIHNGFRPFDPGVHIAIAGKNLTGWTFPANAMEVMNSGSQQTNPTQLYFDWMAMMNRGFILAPVGSSDSHDVSRFIVGQSRTYIRNSGETADETIKNFAEGRVSVSFGLLTEITVNNLYGAGDLVPASGDLQVSVKVMGPGWVKANKITLYANGQKIREAVISNHTRQVVKWQWKWILRNPSHDLILVAVAEGPGTQHPFWPIVMPFQHESPTFKPLLLGITGAIRVDADKDGHFSSAYEYAKTIWDSARHEVKHYIGRLSGFDKSVAIQAASILDENQIDLAGTDVTSVLSHAQTQIRSGFEQYIKYWKMSKDRQKP